MEIERIPGDFSVCRVADWTGVDRDAAFCFTARTDAERSLVCRTQDRPRETLACEDGWRMFRVRGPLDFSLTGVLAKIAALLAEREIPIFAVSTFDTDYILVKREREADALDCLAGAGYRILTAESA